MKSLPVAALILLSALTSALADQSIVEVQQSLKDQGYYYGQITGQKDADTSAAIRRYQIRNGLEITGELNEETLKSIRSNAGSTAQVAPAPAASVAPSIQQAPDTSDLRADSAPSDRGLNAPPVQPPRPGMDQWGDQPNVARPMPPGTGVFGGTPYQTAPPEVQRRVIVDAQRILARRGLFKSEITGAYGPEMEFSLRAYQSRIGLNPSGRLDLETLAALQLLPGAHAPVFTPRRPMPAQPPVRGEWVRP